MADTDATANARYGSTAIHSPSLNSPAERISADPREAVELGSGGLLVLPGRCGFERMLEVIEFYGRDVVLLIGGAYIVGTSPTTPADSSTSSTISTADHAALDLQHW